MRCHQILVEEDRVHRIEQVGGNIAGDEVKSVVNGSLLGQSRGPPGLIKIKILGFCKVVAVIVERRVCNRLAVARYDVE